LLTHPVPFPVDESGKRKIQYMTYEYLNLCEILEIVPDNQGLELVAPEKDEREWKKELDKQEIKGPIIGIAPGSSFGPSKRWNIERFAQVTDELQKKYNAFPVLITGPNEQPIRKQFLKHCSVKVINPFTQSHNLSRLKAVIKNLDLLICNDSGPRHIAVAFGVPTVCIMGPTKPEYTDSPWERGFVVRVPVECGPCQLPECPIDHRCMKLITSQMVLEQVSKILQ
ncbi:MAG: glycosyltransferase family 9 protein, partial [Candidatus Hydrogenedens sp.]